MSKTPVEAAALLLNEEFCKSRTIKDGKCVQTYDQMVTFLSTEMPHLIKDPKNPRATPSENAKKLMAEMDVQPDVLCSLDDFLDMVGRVL